MLIRARKSKESLATESSSFVDFRLLLFPFGNVLVRWLLTSSLYSARHSYILLWGHRSHAVYWNVFVHLHNFQSLCCCHPQPPAPNQSIWQIMVACSNNSLWFWGFCSRKQSPWLGLNRALAECACMHECVFHMYCGPDVCARMHEFSMCIVAVCTCVHEFESYTDLGTHTIWPYFVRLVS